MGRDENIAVFKDTEKLCKTNIEFAVYCLPRDDRNFKIFEQVLKPYCK